MNGLSGEFSLRRNMVTQAASIKNVISHYCDGEPITRSDESTCNNASSLTALPAGVQIQRHPHVGHSRKPHEIACRIHICPGPRYIYGAFRRHVWNGADCESTTSIILAVGGVLTSPQTHSIKDLRTLCLWLHALFLGMWTHRLLSLYITAAGVTPLRTRHAPARCEV